MENILREILEKVSSLDTKVSSLEIDIKDLKEGQSRIEQKLDAVHDQTAKTCEDVTEVSIKIDNLKEDVSFLTHKETLTEKEVYSLKKQLHIIK